MNKYELEERKLTNILHSILLILAMVLITGVIGWTLAGSDGVMWSVLIGGALFIFTPHISPHIIQKIHGARALSIHEAPELYRVLKKIVLKAELPKMPVLYYLPCRTDTAFATGTGDNAAITLSEGMLRGLNMRELAGVLAHEVSHIRNGDLWIMNFANIINRTTALLANVGQILLLLSVPMIILGYMEVNLLPVMILALAPMLTTMLYLALSRTREFDADLDTAYLTNDPDGLAMALSKIDTRRRGLFHRIFMADRGVRSSSLLSTHPPTEERIERLMSLRENDYRQSEFVNRYDYFAKPGRISPYFQRRNPLLF